MTKLPSSHEDDKQNARHTQCPSSMVISGYDTEGELTHFFQTTCNRWSCVVCGPWKTWTFCKRASEAKPNRFITLTTSHHERREPREVWELARRQVPELIRWIRKNRGPCEYARVLEEHKSGYPHFHLLVRGPYVRQSTLSDQWCRLTDAFIVDIRKVDPEGSVAHYVAKYLSKTVSVGMTQRRVTNSKGFFPPKEKKPASNLALEDVQRYRGSIESVWYWEFPTVQLEEAGPNHWISVGEKDPIRGKRFRADNPHDREALKCLTTNHVIKQLTEEERTRPTTINPVRSKTLALFD